MTADDINDIHENNVENVQSSDKLIFEPIDGTIFIK